MFQIRSRNLALLAQVWRSGISIYLGCAAMRHERGTYFTSAAHILTLVGHITQQPSIYISSAMYTSSTGVPVHGCVQFIAHQWISDTKVRALAEMFPRHPKGLKKWSKRRKPSLRSPFTASSLSRRPPVDVQSIKQFDKIVCVIIACKKYHKN